MALATAGALLVTWLTASGMGGSSSVAGLAIMALGIGSVLTFAPAVLKIDREHWGVAVLFSGTARGLVALGAAYLIAQQRPEMHARPLYMGIAAGAILVLVVETFLTISILSRIERAREAMKAAANLTPSTPSAPSNAITDRA
jgi:hypothetical protein